MGKGTQQSPQAVNTLPPEFQQFAQQLSGLLSGLAPGGAAGMGTMAGRFFGTPASGGAAATPGMFQQGQDFLSSLLAGQLPASMRTAAAQNLTESQQALNSQLQQRGAFYGTPGLQMQAKLATDYGTNLNNMIFQNAMQVPGAARNLYGTGMSLAGWPFAQGTDFLSAMRGQLGQSTYSPDPLTQILGSIIPFIKF